jgi:protein-S-isoprenylcysteine O-methyltransferase Ste14
MKEANAATPTNRTAEEKARSGTIIDTLIVVIAVGGLFAFAVSLFQPQSVFPNAWFPSASVASAFKALFSLWVLSEIINSIWSRKNSGAKSQDRGSYWVVIGASGAAMVADFTFRSLGVWTYGGILQYAGLAVLLAGIVLREWAIWVLGKHFTVRVQVREKAELVTDGPYNYVRHPSYTGGLMIFAGIFLAIGSWPGLILGLIICLVAYEYRINVEENALRNAFGRKYHEYRKRTGKLFPGF